MKLKNFLKDYPQFIPNLQFAPANSEFNTTISFFNYFDQVFSGSNIFVDLYLFFFDSDGNELKNFILNVEPSSLLLFDSKNYKINSDGIVAISAVPKVDLLKVKPSSITLRKNISTSYYVKWDNNKNSYDTMHEWEQLLLKPSPTKKFYITIFEEKININNGIIIINNIFDSNSFSKPELKLVSCRTKEIIEIVLLDALPPMSSRILYFNEIFHNFDTFLHEEKSLIVELESENIVPPITIETNDYGDFHFHHL